MIVNSIATRWGDAACDPAVQAGGLAGWHRAWASSSLRASIRRRPHRPILIA
jgi:hypothetical protein